MARAAGAAVEISEAARSREWTGRTSAGSWVVATRRRVGARGTGTVTIEAIVVTAITDSGYGNAVPLRAIGAARTPGAIVAPGRAQLLTALRERGRGEQEEHESNDGGQVAKRRHAVPMSLVFLRRRALSSKELGPSNFRLETAKVERRSERCPVVNSIFKNFRDLPFRRDVATALR